MGQKPTPHLLQRGAVFYFRIAIPRSLWQAFGIREWKGSLRTQDETVARMRGSMCALALKPLILRLASMPNISRAEITSALRKHYETCLKEASEYAFLAPLDKLFDTDIELIDLDSGQEKLRSAIARRRYDPWVIQAATELFSDLTATTPSQKSEDFDYVCNGILRATAEQQRVMAALLRGQMDQILSRDPLFKGMFPTGEMPPLSGDTHKGADKSLKLAIATFIAQKIKGGGWSNTKTIAENRRILQLFCDFVGGQKWIDDIPNEDIRDFRNALMVIPPNFSKQTAFGGLSLRQAVEKCTKDGIDQGLAPKTLQKYVESVHSFLGWCEAEGYATRHPGKKIKAVGKVNEKDLRYPFSSDQLNALFSSPMYAGCKSDRSRAVSGELVIKDDKYWLPLVGLYSGMRLGEMVQMLLADVKTDEDIPFFGVAKGEEDDKSIKTASSVRRIPMHSKLIELGFLDFVKQCRLEDPLRRVFPSFPKGPDGYYSHHASKWFSRYFERIGIKTPKTAFHSFRHNFTDALREGGVDGSRANALCGHADNSVHGAYGSGFSVKALSDSIETVKYDIGLPVI